MRLNTRSFVTRSFGSLLRMKAFRKSLHPEERRSRVTKDEATKATAC